MFTWEIIIEYLVVELSYISHKRDHGGWVRVNVELIRCDHMSEGQKLFCSYV